MFPRIAAFVLALGLSGVAHAAPGDHIRAGAATLVPSLDLGAEYRSNLYRSEIDPSGGANLRIAPQAAFTVGGEDHSFKSSGMWQIRKFMFVQTDADDLLTGAERVRAMDRFNDFALGAGASLFKREVVGFELSDSLNLRNNSTDSPNSETPYTTQLRNTLSGGVRISPGPALKITPGGQWSYDEFRVPDVNEERLLNRRHTYGPSLNAGWAFLPRTSLYFNSSYMVNSWNAGPVLDSVDNADTYVPPTSQFVQAMVGIDGRFTEKLFLNAGAGYGAGIYDEGPNLSGLNGLLLKVAARYQLRESSEAQSGTSFTLGYDKQFRSSFFTNYVAVNRIFSGLQAGLGDFTPQVTYELRFENYDGAVTRSDIVNRVNAGVGYRLAEWASISPGFYWQQRASNVDNIEYDDIGVNLTATFTY